MLSLGPTSIEEPLGKIAFERLRAEDEPWLEACFVPPPDLAQIMGDRSVVVFGRAGSGKTALYRYLLRHCLDPIGKPKRLIAKWRPSLLQPEVSRGIAAVQVQIKQVFEACVLALLNYAAYHSADIEAASIPTRETLAWFIQHFSQRDVALFVNQLMEKADLAGKAALHSLLEPIRQDILYSNASPEQIAAELIRAISALGLEGVWVTVDGLETWAEFAHEELVTGLRAFLSTLPLFERTKFSYKLFVPASLESALASTSGLSRRRIDAYYLRWNTPTLIYLIEKRLILATGQNDLTLNKLCTSPQLIDWLEKVGADSPREWLDQIKPLVTYYLSDPSQKPISEDTWHILRYEYPPRLYIDDVQKRLAVGARQVSLEDVPAKAFDMLLYLSHHGNQVVSKAELYFLAYLGLDHLPRAPGDKDYLAPKEYEGIIDTNLWRLRKAIEPDPSDPVLLVTIRGHGVKLQTRW